MQHELEKKIDEVIEVLNLKPKYILVLKAIARHRNKDTGDCFPGLKLIAKKCNYSVRSIIRFINELQRLGIIEKAKHKRANGSQTTNRYYFTFAALNLFQPDESIKKCGTITSEDISVDKMPNNQPFNHFCHPRRVTDLSPHINNKISNNKINNIDLYKEMEKVFLKKNANMNYPNRKKWDNLSNFKHPISKFGVQKTEEPETDEFISLKKAHLQALAEGDYEKIKLYSQRMSTLCVIYPQFLTIHRDLGISCHKLRSDFYPDEKTR